MPLSRLTIALAVGIALPASAQLRNVDLTGKPVATFAESFTLISAFRELPGGKGIVNDASEHKLFLVDFAASKKSTIGRNGEGPGEYQFPFGLYPGTGTNTLVFDAALSKIHTVSADGKVTSSMLLEGPDVPAAVSTVRGIDAQGRFYFQSVMRSSNGPPPDTLPVARWKPGTKQVDTMAWMRRTGGMTIRVGADGRPTASGAHPYPAADAWAPLPNGTVAIIRAEPYRVDIVTAPGKVQRGTPVVYTPVKVTARDRELYRSANKGGAVVTGGGLGTRNVAIPEASDADFPAVKPAFQSSGVLVTPEGDIWVLRYQAADAPTVTYDIFNSSGALIGKATLKAHTTVVGFGAGAVYVARQDMDDDLRYLEKYLVR